MIDIYVINLKERKDRKEQIENDFKNFASIQLHFIEAIKDDNGAKGCFLSHKKCIQIAKLNNMDYIIVIEDDCNPMEHFEERLQVLNEWLKINKDWNIFLGGVNGTEHQHIEEILSYKDNKFLKILFGGTSHFIVYNSSSYDFFLSRDENTNFIDKCWSKLLNAYTIIPFIAKQRNGYSNIEKTNVNYEKKINNTELRLIQFCNLNQIKQSN